MKAFIAFQFEVEDGREPDITVGVFIDNCTTSIIDGLHVSIDNAMVKHTNAMSESDTMDDVISRALEDALSATGCPYEYAHNEIRDCDTWAIISR